MAVKISKLFRNQKFQELSDDAKLFYIWLATNPDLNTVGVLSPNLEVAMIELNKTMQDIRRATLELRTARYLYVYKYDVVYFVVPAHFSTIPKSEASVNKIHKDLAVLPELMVHKLAQLGITVSNKVRRFVKPTPEQVREYALSHGYVVNGDDFIEYYDRQAERYGKNHWVDGNGKQVKDWRAKLRRIWCKEENRIPHVDGAPKGFEHYHVLQGDTIITPDKWKDGLPWSNNITSNIILQREFKKRST